MEVEAIFPERRSGRRVVFQYELVQGRHVIVQGFGKMAGKQRVYSSDLWDGMLQTLRIAPRPLKLASGPNSIKGLLESTFRIVKTHDSYSNIAAVMYRVHQSIEPVGDLVEGCEWRVVA